MCGANPCASPSCTWSREHLLQCEAKAVMRLPREKRVEYYAAVLKKRGKEATEDLRNRVNAAWKASQLVMAG